MHLIILVMGVSGSGKSTIGQALADALGATFLDGDDYHPAENVAHMAAGKPLTDGMRWPWLTTLSDAVQTKAKDGPVVFACSALKRAYRDHLRVGCTYRLVYPDASSELIAARLSARENHFMPAGLLQSQFDTLEVPDTDEDAIRVDIDQPVDAIVASIRAALAGQS